MYLKYLIKMDESAIALKYHLRNGNLIIGGKSRFVNDIIIVLKKYFNLKPGTMIWTQKNKLRFVCQCKDTKFFKGIEELHGNNIVLEQKKDLGNVMR